MEKKVLISLALVIVFITIVGLFIRKYPSYNVVTKKETSVQQKTVTINNKVINVEIANTESLREKGLGDRNSLATDSGMLFVFDSKPSKVSFWMKGMLIPLDIIWIKDGKINKIDKNVPFYPKDIPDSHLKIYASSSVDYVLEVNSGFSEKNKFKVGNAVILPTL